MILQGSEFNVLLLNKVKMVKQNFLIIVAVIIFNCNALTTGNRVNGNTIKWLKRQVRQLKKSLGEIL